MLNHRFIASSVALFATAITCLGCSSVSPKRTGDKVTTDLTVAPVARRVSLTTSSKALAKRDGRDASFQRYFDSRTMVFGEYRGEIKAEITNASTDLMNYNISLAHARHAAVLSIACPTLFAVGTLGNILCFITLRGKSFGSSPTNFILSTMLVVDQCILSVNFVVFWLTSVYDIYLIDLHSIACSVLPFLYPYLRHLSAFLVCLLTVERLIAVYVPLRCKQLCSARRIKIVCCSALAAYVPIDGFFLISTRLDAHTLNDGTVKYSCDFYHPWRDWIWWFFCKVWFPIYSSLTTFIPATLLVVLNGLIVYKIVTSRRAMQTSRPTNNVSTASSNFASTTIILFLESITFLVFHLPLEVLLYEWGRQSREVYERTVRGFHHGALEETVKLLTYTSSALNFALYMVTGQRFRKAFSDTFCMRRSDNVLV